MEMYLLKSALCLLVFVTFYKLLLERTSLHTFKRFYLLSTTLLAFVIPLITFRYEVIVPNTDYVETSVASEVTDPNFLLTYLPYILWTIYGLGVVLFGIKFGKNLSGLIKKIRNNPKLKIQKITNVLLSDQVTPHTFFSYIFLNKFKFETQQIPKEVLIHEETHALEKHSLDVLLIELLQVIFWFNPLVYILKRSIKLNHEFLADRAVLEEGIGASAYQQTLLAFSSNAVPSPLANSINYSLIKKRFTVMKTHTSRGAKWVLGLLFMPLVGLLIFGFSNKVPDYIPEEEKLPMVVWEKTPDAVLEVTLQEDQDKATQKMVNEYNALARKYNNMAKNNMRIKAKEFERMEYIYSLMSEEQRENAQPFPDVPPPPPPAPEADSPKRIKKGAPDAPPPPPPPPPIPDGATDEEKEEYERAYISYEKMLKEYERASGDNESAMRAYMEALKEREKKMKSDNEAAIKQYEEALKRQKELKEERDGERLAESEKRMAELVRRNAEFAKERAARLAERQKNISSKMEERNLELAKKRFEEMKDRRREREVRTKERVEAMKKRKEKMKDRLKDDNDGKSDQPPKIAHKIKTDIKVNPVIVTDVKLKTAAEIKLKTDLNPVVKTDISKVLLNTKISDPVIKTDIKTYVNEAYKIRVKDSPVDKKDNN